MRPWHPTILFIFLVSLSGCTRNSVSGKYLAKFNNGAYWLQLVETKDGHITGQFETAVLGTDGKLQTTDWGVTGAADGKDISLSLEPLPGIPLSQTASGTLSWGKLRLTGNFSGSQPTTVEFNSSDQQAFQRELETLNARSRAILLGRAKAEAQRRLEQQQAKLVKNLQATLSRIRRFEAFSHEDLPKLTAAEQRYAAITARMQDYFDRERQLSQNPSAGVARAQIVVAMDQGTMVADQLHNQISLAASSFENNIGALSQKAVRFEQTCREYHPANLPTYEQAAWTDACHDLSTSLPSFRTQFDATGKAFVSAERTYLRERDNQSNLMRQASRIQ